MAGKWSRVEPSALWVCLLRFCAEEETECLKVRRAGTPLSCEVNQDFKRTVQKRIEPLLEIVSINIHLRHPQTIKVFHRLVENSPCN